MNRRTQVLCPVFGLVAGMFGGMVAGCEQPEPKCVTAHGNFATTFELVSQAGDGTCGELTSGVLNVQSYNETLADSMGMLDPDKPLMAIQDQNATNLIWDGRETNPSDTAFAIGAFDSPEPDGDGYCSAASLSPARIRASATEEVPGGMIDECTLDPGMPALPAVDMAYKWSNIRVLVTPSAIGTKFTADLEYSEGDCVATYKVAAVWPIVECAEVDEDAPEPAAGDPVAEGCPEPDPAPPAMRAPTAEEDYCLTQGAIPDLPVVCNPDLLMCVLK